LKLSVRVDVADVQSAGEPDEEPLAEPVAERLQQRRGAARGFWTAQFRRQQKAFANEAGRSVTKDRAAATKKRAASKRRKKGGP
jgi:hypothetical protein